MASGRKTQTKEPKSLKSNKEKTNDAQPIKVPHRFLPGNTMGGRPKGSRNKFAQAFFDDFLADWEIAGASAIQQCRLEDPSTYCRIAASLIPKELNLSHDSKLLDRFLDELSPEQTLELLNGVRALGAGTKTSEEGAARLT